MKCFYIGVIYKGTFTGSQGKRNGGVSKKKKKKWRRKGKQESAILAVETTPHRLYEATAR
jgi:hypothetical protein